MGPTGTSRVNLGGEVIVSPNDKHSVVDGTENATIASDVSENEKTYDTEPTESNVRNGGRAGGVSITENFHTVKVRSKSS